MVTLASNTGKVMTFSDIKDTLGMTSGNLSIQIKTLEAAGYIQTKKYIDDNKSRTDVAITKEGRTALVSYMESLETFLSGVKK